MRYVLPLVVVFALPAAAAAQDKVDCDNAMTQTEMNLCAEQDYRAADAELNAVYRKAMAAMKQIDGDLDQDLKGAVDALRDAQRAWVPYRNKACAAEGYLARGGTMEPMLVSGCLERLTRQRIGDLQVLVDGLGN